MRAQSIALAAVLALLAGGCFRHTWVVAGATPGERPEYDSLHHHLLWGIADLSGEVELRAVCPQGIAQIDEFLGPFGVVLSALTLGFYSPWSVQVYCDQIVIVPTPTAPPPSPTPPGGPPIMVPLPATDAGPAPRDAGPALR